MGSSDQDTPVPGALYLRQSKDATGLGLAVARQEQDGITLAARRGIIITETLADNDISAAGGKKRPGFERLMELIESGTARAVIAWDLDRLTRNWRDMVRLIEAGMDRDLMILLVQGGDMDMGTPSGRMMAGVRASVARNEIEVKSVRQKRANLQAAQQGKRVSGRRPFGYGPDGVTLRRAEALAIEDGYRLLLAGGSLAEIARRWNGRKLTSGQKTRDGKPSHWRHDSVTHVLRNPRYAGLRAYNGEIITTAVWPAIISEDTWRQAQAILTDESRRTSNRGGPHLLTAIALCGVCGGPVHRGGAARGYPTYRCGTAGGHVSRKALPAEEYISALATGWFARMDAAGRLARAEPADTARLLEDRAVLERRIDEATAEFGDDDDVTPAQLRAITRRYRARIADVDARLAEGRRSSILVPLLGQDIREAWETRMTMSEKRAIVAALMTPRLLPPGRGVRVFHASSIDPGWRL